MKPRTLGAEIASNGGMANRLPARHSDTDGRFFGIFMLAIVFFIVLLMWYFGSHQDAGPMPPQPPGIMHQL
jgi:hypothetical protein